MSHEIDMTLERPAIAYVGETPWHGLGQKLSAGASIAEWTREAGLSYDVLDAPVEYLPYDVEHPDYDGGRNEFAGRKVLYRSDTLTPLSVVSTQYRQVQPAEVMAFFAELTDIAGFDMETAGALCDGKRIWALAKVADGAPVLGHDVVRPYCLLATSNA